MKATLTVAVVSLLTPFFAAVTNVTAQPLNECELLLEYPLFASISPHVIEIPTLKLPKEKGRREREGWIEQKKWKIRPIPKKPGNAPPVIRKRPPGKSGKR